MTTKMTKNGAVKLVTDEKVKAILILAERDAVARKQQYEKNEELT